MPSRKLKANDAMGPGTEGRDRGGKGPKEAEDGQITLTTETRIASADRTAAAKGGREGNGNMIGRPRKSGGRKRKKFLGGRIR